MIHFHIKRRYVIELYRCLLYSAIDGMAKNIISRSLEKLLEHEIVHKIGQLLVFQIFHLNVMISRTQQIIENGRVSLKVIPTDLIPKEPILNHFLS